MSDLTVILTTRNRASSLERTLEHIQSQPCSGFTRAVIVVDDGSTDATRSVLHRAWPGLSMTALSETGVGVSAARNRAIALAESELLVLTDDDVEPAPFWLESLWELASRWPTHAIFGGPVIPHFPPTAPRWLRTSVFIGPLFTGFAPRATEGLLSPPTVPLGPNTMVRRSQLGSVSFDVLLGPGSAPGAGGEGYPVGADVAFALRLVERTGAAVYSPNAAVRHHIRDSQLAAGWLRSRAANWGRGVVHLFPDHVSPRREGVPVYLSSWLDLAWERASPLLDGDPSPADDRFELVLFWEFLRGVMLEERGHRARDGVVPTQPPEHALDIRRRYAGLTTAGREGSGAVVASR